MSDVPDEPPAERAPGPPEDGESAHRLRDEVEERYDFDDFGPADMAEMSPEEWEAAFDPDSWVTGRDLLDRVERDLTARVATRDVFAVVERDDAAAVTPDDAPVGGECVVAYSDEGYAIVYEDGNVEGRGTVLRDVKPSVALCSMPDYDVPDGPVDADLPDPAEVPDRSGALGNTVLQVVGGVQVLAGLVLLGAWLVRGVPIVAVVAAFGFLTIGVLLLVVVANARLSDRFRSEEYRERLRDAGVATGERPDFVPGSGDERTGDGGVDADADRRE